MTRVTPKSLAAAVPVTKPTLLDVLPRFQRHLAAENKAPRTIKSYSEAVERLHEYLVGQGMPSTVAGITAEHVEMFLADQLARLRPSSARVRYASLRQFFLYVARELGEVTTSPMVNMRPPAVPEQPVPVMSEEKLRALLRTTERDRSFLGLRDAAILRLFVDTGARLSEVSNLLTDDVNLSSGAVTFMGKGRRTRVNAIGSKTVRALDRYIAVRDRHPDAATPVLWLGTQGPMTSVGVAEAVKRRADHAGVGPLHVHQLRHSAAHHWRLEGMDDDSVMRNMGWRDRSMLHRYGASAADERAQAAHRRLSLADRL